jgi:menaquinone-dependent protoporphyrinogen oxidase
MANILIVFSTTDGHTLRICNVLKRVIESNNHTVSLVSVADPLPADLQRFDKIVVGASIRYGKHQRKVYDFIKAHQALLESKANAFFSVNIVARKPEKNLPETNPYLIRFLKQIAWRPQLLGVFAGKLNYPSYGFFDREMIRFIMWITKGPTDPTSVVEFTDWRSVEAFGQRISEL